jgi:Cys-tRNA(Pro)/Cys-tRNA(Cys) deacylase
MRGSTPAITSVLEAGVAHRVHELPPAPTTMTTTATGSYGRRAAEALGVEPARVFKTLICDVRGQAVVAVVPVTGELDPKALATALGAKAATLADRAAAERSTGYVIGGMSPLGQRRKLLTVIDESAELWETVFVSAGRRGLELELAPGDLVRLTDARLAPLGAPR